MKKQLNGKGNKTGSRTKQVSARQLTVEERKPFVYASDNLAGARFAALRQKITLQRSRK